MEIGENDFRVRERCGYSWRVKYTFDGTAIVVLCKLTPLFENREVVDRLKSEWQEAIHHKWDSRFLVPTSNRRLRVDFRWVDHDPHYEVKLHNASEFRQSDMLNWDSRDSGHDASHEFGHMIGLFDEYPLDACSARSPVRTGSVMDRNTGDASQRLVDTAFNRNSEGDTRSPDNSRRHNNTDIRFVELLIRRGERDTGSRLRLRVDKNTGKTMLQVIDRVTGYAAHSYTSSSIDLMSSVERLLNKPSSSHFDLTHDILPHSTFAEIRVGSESSKASFVIPLDTMLHGSVVANSGLMYLNRKSRISRSPEVELCDMLLLEARKAAIASGK